MGNHQAALQLHRSRSRLVAHEVTARTTVTWALVRPSMAVLLPERHRRGTGTPVHEPAQSLHTTRQMEERSWSALYCMNRKPMQLPYNLTQKQLPNNCTQKHKHLEARWTCRWVSNPAEPGTQSLEPTVAAMSTCTLGEAAGAAVPSWYVVQPGGRPPRATRPRRATKLTRQVSPSRAPLPK